MSEFNLYFRLPSIQSNEEPDENMNEEDRPLSPLSVDSEEERQLLQQVNISHTLKIVSFY